MEAKGIGQEQRAEGTAFVVELLASRFTIIWTNLASAAGSKRKVAAILDEEDEPCECGEQKVRIRPTCEGCSKVHNPNGLPASDSRTRKRMLVSLLRLKRTRLPWSIKQRNGSRLTRIKPHLDDGSDSGGTSSSTMQPTARRHKHRRTSSTSIHSDSENSHMGSREDVSVSSEDEEKSDEEMGPDPEDDEKAQLSWN